MTDVILIITTFFDSEFADAVLQAAKRSGVLCSAMFSPAEPTVIALASMDDGAVLYDIRNIKRFVLII